MDINNNLRTFKSIFCLHRITPPVWFICSIVIVLVGCHSADDPDLLKVGLSEEPRTLNIWLAGDANTRKVLNQIYEPLYYRDPKSLKFMPWLAAEMPEFDTARNTYTVKLRPSMKWSDGTPFTAHDVVFTGHLIQSFKVPRYSSKWRLVKKIIAIDDTTVQFHIKKPFATFLSGTLIAPIVPAHQWAPIVEKANSSKKKLAALLNHEISNPVGSGPFKFKEWQQGNYLYLEKNPLFFGTRVTVGGRTLGPHINGILFKIYGATDVAVLALRKGDIDLFWSGIQPGHLEQLNRTPQISVFNSKKSALYYMGFNTRRPPFDDAALRQAIATLIDKEFIVQRILQGAGTRMDAIIPPGNVQWYSDNVIRHGENLSREDRIREAFQHLSQAGYGWTSPPVDAQGRIQKAEALRLPSGELMPQFSLLTPPADYDPHRAMSGMMIQEWLKDLGIPVYARPMHFSSLLQKIKTRHDFDAFILGYGRLSLDPDYLRFFFVSQNDKLQGWNMSGYRNPEYDRIAIRSQSEMNTAARQQMIHKMQRIISRDVPYLPLYNPDLLEAVRTDRFTGWVPMIDGIGNRWSFCMLKPVESVTEKD